MTTITVRLDEKDKELIQQFAKFNNISTSELVRCSVLDKIESEIDKNLYQKAVAILNNNEPTISFDEMMKEIGLDDV